MEQTVRQAFASRLREAMLKRGYVAKRGARHGVDVAPLKAAAGLRTIEMARRYVTGKALPDPERLSKIAKWLDVTVPWLRDGALALQESKVSPYREDLIDPDLFEEIVEQIDQRLGAQREQIPSKKRTRAAILIYEQCLKEGRAPDPKIVERYLKLVV